MNGSHDVFSKVIPGSAPMKPSSRIRYLGSGRHGCSHQPLDVEREAIMRHILGRVPDQVTWQ